VRTVEASSPLLRVAATVSAVAIALVAIGSTAASAGTAKATIDTFPSWDGSTVARPFGCPDTTTYGQAITVPAGKTHLNKFTFAWINLTSGTMVVQAEVYAWNGKKATGPSLYRKKRTISFQDNLFHLVTFRAPNGVSVTAGAQYVLFASIDRVYEECRHNYELGWGWTDTDSYNGGAFVYQNNSGNEKHWKTVPWDGFGATDLAFKALLS
jgi:hypothetical protein